LSVAEDVIIDACIAGNLAQLRQWARRGVQVASAVPLIQAALAGKLAVVMCLVRDLGADPNGANENGCTAVYMAAMGGARGCCAVHGQGAWRRHPHG
jgi:hypothetical protein